MDRSNKAENQDPMNAAISEWKERSPKERRGKNRDKRASDSLNYISKGGKERRKIKERRQSGERRDKWMRVGKWRSISVFDE